MEEIRSLPHGYTRLSPPWVEFFLPHDSDLAIAEANMLLGRFGKQDSRVGICVETSSMPEAMKYISRGLQLQQQDKNVVFYPCVSSEEVLLEIVNTFSFFNPGDGKHGFSVIPNSFYGHLTPLERIVTDIRVLNSMGQIIISPEHPYRNLIDNDNMLDVNNPDPFVFDLSEEACM